MQSTSLQTVVPRPNCCRPCKASSHVPRYCDLIVMAIESLSRSSYLTSRRSLKFLMLFWPLTSIEGFLKSYESFFNQTQFWYGIDFWTYQPGPGVGYSVKTGTGGSLKIQITAQRWFKVHTWNMYSSFFVIFTKIPSNHYCGFNGHHRYNLLSAFYFSSLARGLLVGCTCCAEKSTSVLL
jgi:hypothetical protein